MKIYHKLRNLFAMLAVALAFTACGDDKTEPDPQPKPQSKPSVTLTKGEATANSLSFSITSTNALEVKWVMAPQGMEVTAAQVLENGTAVTNNTTVPVTVNELMSETEYQFYAAAKNETFEVLSTVLKMTTLKNEEPGPTPSETTYEMEANRVITEITTGTEFDNYRISFSDEAQNMTLFLNAYTLNGYRPEGIFAFGETIAEQTILFTDSYFAVEGENKTILNGEVVFSGSSVENDFFTIEGVIEMENNESVEFFYEGALGLPEVPAGPTEVHMSLNIGNAEAGDNPGEWILTFYDDFMNQVVLYFVSPTMNEYPDYLPDANYWFCSPEEEYSSDKYGWINTERSYVKYGTDELKFLPRDLSINRNPSVKFSTNYDEEPPRDSNTLETNVALLTENDAYKITFKFLGPLYGDGSTITIQRELDKFKEISEYSTSPDGTKLLIRLYAYYGDLYFCLNIGEGKTDITGEIEMTKDENGQWSFPQYESFEFDVLTEMDLQRSYLWEPALGNTSATVFNLTGGKIRISRSNDTTFQFRAIDLTGVQFTNSATYVLEFQQSNNEKGWSCTLNDSDEWSYNWDKVEIDD